MFGGLGRNRTTDTRIFKTKHGSTWVASKLKKRNGFRAGGLSPGWLSLNPLLNFPGSVGLSPCGMSNGIKGIAGCPQNGC